MMNLVIIDMFFSLKYLVDIKPYNLTYFIRLSAVATFADHKSVPFNRKPYKMFYIAFFIMKTIKENINSKEVKKLMIYTRGRENLRRNTKNNLLRTFVFLYCMEDRISEL
jgi:hypothetical protein